MQRPGAGTGEPESAFVQALMCSTACFALIFVLPVHSFGELV
jgi:hypothetical protein